MPLGVPLIVALAEVVSSTVTVPVVGSVPWFAMLSWNVVVEPACETTDLAIPGSG